MITMSLLVVIGYISGAMGFVAVITAAVIVAKSTTKNTTISSQKELIDTLMIGKEEQKEQIADLINKHAESTAAIANLQGQVDVLKNIPLKEISSDLRHITNTQRDIVKLLKEYSSNGKAKRG